MSYLRRIGFALICSFVLLSFGCVERKAAIPLESADAGIRSGFDLSLPKVDVDDRLVAQCVRDSSKEIRLNKTIGSNDKNFLIFDLVHEYGGPAVVYVVEKGKLKFKFRYQLPGSSS